jgi:uncharacterized protein YbbC (DUF1343 family)
MHNFLLSSIITLLFSCSQPRVPNAYIAKSKITTNVDTVILGAERPGIYVPKLQGKRVALVVNQTSMIGSKHIVDSLIKLGVDVRIIMAPEHGFRGKADAGEVIANEKDGKTGLPIISLYGKHKKPLPEDLANIDIVIFDIQDVGARFYTYISTLHYVMEACAENSKVLMIFDRPNPNGHYVDGPVLEPAFKSFVGMHSVPVVHGMTIGEYANMVNGEGWLSNGAKCKLDIIHCKNYDHKYFYTLPVKPSPNLPNQRAIYLYPSICFFEGTNLSLGRGTEKQFQVIGHPGLKDDFSFTPQPNEGAKDPILKGQLCYGEDLSELPFSTIRDTNQLNIAYLISYYKKCKEKGIPFFLENKFIDKLAGTSKLREQIIAGKSEKEIRATWKSDLDQFNITRKKYLIYQ